MQSVIPFNFDDDLVRAVMRDGEPWFLLADVCKVLGIQNSGNAATRLDDDEKGFHSMDTLGGSQEMTIISESGLYALTLTSRKEEARRFRKWVTTELLPTLRRTGRYALAPAMQAEPVIAANFDPNALTAAVGAVREARRLKGVAAALHLWARLGLPSLDGDAVDDLGAAVAAVVEGLQEITGAELAQALGHSADDLAMRRMAGSRLAAMGWANVPTRRGGQVLRVWRRGVAA